jgi:lariat debranching enzyme
MPPKYRRLGSFPRYYSGEKEAPILTLFIGGNHEASQPLRELYYGGWAAPKIYYLGAVGVVRFGGLRIGGISGIYKSHDYQTGHHGKFFSLARWSIMKTPTSTNEFSILH